MSKEKLTYSFYVNGEKVDKLSEEVLDRMAENLGKSMSLYYTQHMSEFVKLKGKENDNVRRSI